MSSARTPSSREPAVPPGSIDPSYSPSFREDALIRFPPRWWALLLVLVSAYLLVAVGTTNLRHHSYGDVQTLTVVMTGGRNFAAEGFIANRLTPRIPNKRADWSTAPEAYYTHFPPLPYYVTGLVWKCLGSMFAIYKLLFIFFAALFLAGLFLLVARLFGPGAGLLAVAAVMVHPFLYSQMQTTAVVIGDVFKVFGLVTLLHALEARGRRRAGWLALTWIIYFLNAYTTFEYIVAFWLLSVGLVWLRLREGPWRWFWWSFLLGLAPVASMVVHLLINGWALGGLDAAWLDLAHSFVGRTVGNETYATDTLGGIGGIGGYPGWLTETLMTAHSLQWWTVPVLAAGCAWLAFWIPRLRATIGLYALLALLFFLADMTFYVMFPQLTMIHIRHANVGRNWLTTYALLAGVGFFLLVFAGWPWLRGARRLLLLPALAAGLMLLPTWGGSLDAARAFLQTAPHSIWEDEVELLADVMRTVPPGEALMTTSPLLAQGAFYHQPRESFGLPPFTVNVVGDLDAIMARVPPGGGPGYLLRPLRSGWAAREEAVEQAIRWNPETFSLLRVFGNHYSLNNLLPRGTAITRNAPERPSAGPYRGTYNAQVAVADRDLETTGTYPGRWCLRVTALPGERSGVTMAPGDGFSLAAGRRYAVSWQVYSEKKIEDLRFGIQAGSQVFAAGHPTNGSPSNRVEAGRWTTLGGSFESPVTTDTANIFLWCLEPGPFSWYVDEVTLGESGGWGLYAVHPTLPQGEDVGADLFGLSAVGGAGDSDQLGPLIPIYRSDLTVADSAIQPGEEGAGDYNVRITSDGAERSGFSQKVPFPAMAPGDRYRIRLLIHTPDPVANFHIGFANQGAGILWANNPATGLPPFRSEGGRWTPLRAELTMPETTSGTTALWIVQWDKSPLTWQVDGLQVTRLD